MNIEVFTMTGLKTHKEQSEFCLNKLKEICEKKYNYNVESDKIGRSEHGKPYFTDNVHLHFNISHTKGMGVVIVDDQPCGVDVEVLKSVKLSMAKRFFTDDELNWILESMDEEVRIERFFRVWTGKEAYTKMLGCGLTIPMDSYDILSEEISSKLKYYKLDNFLICVCSEKNITDELTLGAEI